MSSFEKAVGNTIALILIFLVIASFIMTIFSLLFRDGRGITLYGNRGEFYISE